jgi:O-antigen/teichoic acid export membrane protein
MFANVYRRFRPYLHNTGWILAEKVLVLGLGFLATVLVARYLGPEGFGTLAYAMSLVALFAASGHLGLHGLVVRELVKQPALRAETLGTSAFLKFAGALAGYLILLLYAVIYEGFGTVEFALVSIAGAALLLRPIDVIDYWFNAFVQARYVSIARVSAQLVYVGVTLLLVFRGSDLVSFAVPYLLLALTAAIMLLVLYRATASIRLSEWRFNKTHAKNLLKQGWIIYLASFFAVIYLKIDQVMLRWLADSAEVGVYAVAARFSEVWYFVPTAIVATVFPDMIKLRDSDESRFTHRLQQLFDSLAVLGMVVALLVTVLAPWVIPVIFGAEYAGSVAILVIHTWASVFIFMRAALSKWILIENALYFSLLTQGLGAFTNIVLNYFLIPVYGGEGAAWATLVSYAIASFFALFLYRRTRPIFWLMLNALVAPVRYPLKFLFTR